MALGVRQQGEIAYLMGALGIGAILERLDKLESRDKNDVVFPTLEERHSRGLANLADLSSTTMTSFSPEGEPDPEPEEDVDTTPEGTVNPDETVQESHPAVAVTESDDVDLDALLAEDDTNYEELNVDELKALLRERGQPVSGNRAELIDRLEQGDQDLRQ